mmetsp:Transcript_30075/g.22337  ORF Transcript_30075/g.22337 Transcript_30075/m.22337 type:complete len:99 (+) Transcript_30075:195-491(+)
MVDAWTQTERSDYSIIKSRMLSHQQYAYSLVKQAENPLRMKSKFASGHYPHARTPTQTNNLFGKGEKQSYRYKFSANEAKSPDPGLQGKEYMFQSLGK